MKFYNQGAGRFPRMMDRLILDNHCRRRFRLQRGICEGNGLIRVLPLGPFVLVSHFRYPAHPHVLMTSHDMCEAFVLLSMPSLYSVMRQKCRVEYSRYSSCVILNEPFTLQNSPINVQRPALETLGRSTLIYGFLGFRQYITDWHTCMLALSQGDV